MELQELMAVVSVYCPASPPATPRHPPGTMGDISPKPSFWSPRIHIQGLLRRRMKKLILHLLCVLFLLPPLSGTEAVRVLSKKLNKHIKKDRDMKLAVLNFTYPRGRTSTGSILVSERLITYFVQDGAIVIERRHLEKLLEEKRLSQTGLLRSDATDKIGKILGVDAVAVGTLQDLSSDATEVLARIIRVDTGEILSAASIVMDRMWPDKPRIPRVAQMRSPVPMTAPSKWVRPKQREAKDPVESYVNGRRQSRSRRKKRTTLDGVRKPSKVRITPVPGAFLKPIL